MKNLTQKEREQIALEEFRKQPLENVGIVAIVKIAEIAISTGAESGTFSTEATLNGKRYEIKALVTYKEIDFVNVE